MSRRGDIIKESQHTGHLGSASTIHANSAEQAFTRLAHCVLTANVGLPHRSVREAIALAIHVIVHIARVDGDRRVTEIVDVRGYDGETDRFVLEPAIVREGSLEGGAP
jgi:pilus assembly protein CpaF